MSDSGAGVSRFDQFLPPSSFYENDLKMAIDQHDCCDSPCCLCAPYKDEHYFKNRLCLKFRYGDLLRLCTGALLGLILGVIIAAVAMPEKPGARQCLGSSTIEFGDPCEDFGYAAAGSDDLADVLDMGTTAMREISVCFENTGILDQQKTRQLLLADGSTCGGVLKTFSALSGDEKGVCFKKNDDGSVLLSLEDDEDCSKFESFFGDISPTFTYVDEIADGGAEEASCVTSTDTFQSGGGKIDISHGGNCANINSFSRFTEDSATGKAKQDEYDAAWKLYKRENDFVFNWLGRMWYRGLKLVCMPLVIANIITAIGELKALPNPGMLGCYTFLYYLLTTILAAVTGLLFVLFFLVPFMKDLNLEGPDITPSQTYSDTGAQMRAVIQNAVPPNVVDETIKENYLGIICFSITLGCVIPRPNSIFFDWFKEANKMMLEMIMGLILLTPLGLFCILTYIFATMNLTEVLTRVSLFLVTVFVALAFHNLVTYPSLYFFFVRKNPFAYMYNVIPAAVVALGVSSSIATLPVTIKCAEKNNIRYPVAKFVLSLGATINMDGTSIGFPCAAVFVAYAEGIHLSFGGMVVAVIMSTVSSMGAAPIPQSGFVLLVVILSQLNIPTAEALSLILAVDWLYDRPETMTNIVGDSIAAGIMDHYLGEEFSDKMEEIEKEEAARQKFLEVEKAKLAEAKDGEVEDQSDDESGSAN